MKTDSEKGYFEEGLVFWEEGDGFDFNPNTIALTFHELERKRSVMMLPGGFNERQRLDETPHDLCISKSIGWNTRLLIRRANLSAFYKFLYKESADASLLPGLSGDRDDLIEINGWWD